MDKKNIILLGIVTILIAAPIFFYQWQSGQDLNAENGNEEQLLENGTKEWSLQDDYTNHETGGGIIIKNKLVDLSFFVDENWTINGIAPSEEVYFIRLLSPDAEIKDAFLLVDGCEINVDVVRNEVAFLNLKTVISSVLEDPEGYKNREISEEVIEISRRKALKTSINSNDVEGDANGIVYINIPTKEDKVILFAMHFTSNSRKNCMQEFDEFLGRVTIE